MRLVLVGEKGVGKSTIGLALSKKMQLPFFNVDDLLHNSIAFPYSNTYTQEKYKEKKKLENSIISQILSQQKKFILSTGAGFMNGRFDDEHLLKRVKLFTKIICLQNQMDNIRSNQSSLIINVEEKSVNDIVDEIISKL